MLAHPISSSRRVVLALTLLAISATPISSQTGPDANSAALSDSLTAAQIAKTRLEIQHMQKEEQLQQNEAVLIISLVTAAIGVLGALGTFVKYLRDRSAERKEKREALIRKSLSRLVSFPRADGATVSQATFAVLDLKQLLHDEPQRLGTTTELIAGMILNELDFSNVRHARLDLVFLESWPDYTRYLQENPRVHRFMLYMYCRALAQLHAEDPPYFEKIGYDRQSGRYDVEEYTKESRYLHFETLARGFRAHLDLVPSGSDLRKEALDRFVEALNNPILTEQLFGPVAPKV